MADDEDDPPRARRGSQQTDPLALELAVERLEAELAIELPQHMRAFARAHAEGRPLPPVPMVARRGTSRTIARDALGVGELADRGLALFRLLAPIAVEDDRAVAAARAAPQTWENLALLTQARDAAARQMFELDAIELMHRLHGSFSETPCERSYVSFAVPDWTKRDVVLDAQAIVDAWNAIAMRHNLMGNVRFDRTTTAKPRTFVVEPGIETIVVIPAVVDSPAARFAVLHELGHAVVSLTAPGVPRIVDEAVASYIARLMEGPSYLHPRWESPLAAAARRRRQEIAATLDSIERALPGLPEPVTGTPPWALWHDPGSQASYYGAEAIADRLLGELGLTPARNLLASYLTVECGRVDRATSI